MTFQGSSRPVSSPFSGVSPAVPGGTAGRTYIPSVAGQGPEV